MTCAEVRERAAEFALGILPGDERAGVVAHMETCAACRREVDTLSRTADDLVAAAPEREPPPGFEGRVLAGLPARLPRRRRLPSRAALVAVAAAFLVGLGIPLAFDAVGHRDPHLQQAILRKPSGQAVGAAALASSKGAWLDMNLSELPDEAYTCTVILADGTTRVVGRLPAGSGWWGGRIPVDPSKVVAIRVLEPDGSVFAEGRMPLAS